VSYLIGNMGYAGASAGSQVYVPDEDRTYLWRPEWSYWCRGVHLQPSAAQYVGLWPSSRLSSGDPTQPLSRLGQDSCQTGGGWGPWEIGTTGTGGPTVFLSGQTLDGNSNPLAGVLVQGFVTSNDLFVGQTTSDANGNYSLGSPYVGVAHYLVAYLPGSPDRAGTTVDTLVPA
jgi:hypothetical protein